jgi:hypothetical protein
MTETQMIQAQLKRAHMLFEGFGPAFDRPKEIANGILTLGSICDALIRAIEKQQSQIVELNAAIDGLNSYVARQVDTKSESESTLCECGHRLRFHGLWPGCSEHRCSCPRFRRGKNRTDCK